MSASVAILEALKDPALNHGQRLALVAALEALASSAAPAGVPAPRAKRAATPQRRAESVRITRESVTGLPLPLAGERLVYDTAVPQLAVRLRPGGRSYVFIAWDRTRGHAVKTTLGKVDALTPDQARTEAKRLLGSMADGKDARRKTTDATTVGDAWAVYMREGKPRKKEAWKPRYKLDLQRAAAPGGEKKARGDGLTKPGPLAPLMRMRLVDINADTVRDWHAQEAERGGTQAARALAMFAGFLSWCSTRTDFRELVDAEAATARTHARALPKQRRRTDALDRAHLAPWFTAVRALPNAAAAAYLQALVLTGARREEMAALAWADVDTRAHSITIADKVGDRRTIPLTPHLAGLIDALPRLNDFVFASPSAKSGRITEPRAPHEAALAAAELPHVSIHGLRRSFALLAEAAGVPAGASAQIMGHTPSATHEGYKPRRLEDLREFAERIEKFVLERAGVVA